MFSNNTQVGCLNDTVGTQMLGPKCAKKISPTPLHQPELLIQGRNGMAYMAFVLFTLNTDPTIQMSQQTKQPFSSLLLSNFGEPVLIVYPQFPVLR